MTSGRITQIQRYSVHDGPGIRTTVFLKGCPLDCWWCHNPETRSVHPEVIWVETRCTGCDECREVCPQGGPIFADLPKDGTSCIACGNCVQACPADARKLVGCEMTVADVLAEVLKDRIFFDDSGGGVTLSGGEPLGQMPFVRELLQACRQQGIHTAVDTCGFAAPADLLAIVPWTDLFLYDLKMMDLMRHIQFTGVSNEPILDNLKTLGAVHNNLWVRIPLIPGVNDHPDELTAMARFAASVPGVRQVNLLPYHATAVAKFRRLHQPYRLDEVGRPSPEQMELSAEPFRALGLTTILGG
jgi:pyruvate formate lyase activating enzyme